MSCHWCGKNCETDRHQFFTGLAPESAKSLGKTWPCGELWYIEAPTYFKASADFRRMENLFCGAVCATKWNAAAP